MPFQSACNARDRGDKSLIPGSGRSPGGRLCNPLQDSCLENPMDRGALAGYSPRGHKQSDTAERLSTATPLQLLRRRLQRSGGEWRPASAAGGQQCRVLACDRPPGCFPGLFLRTESPLCEMPCPWRGLLCAGLPVAKSAADHRLPPERASLPPCRSGLWLLHSGVGRAPTCCSGPLGPGQPPGHPRWVCEERGGADPSPGPSQVAQW